jgi:NADPH:quinone reductase-like Zn-dependent oxidoreductase
VASSPHFPPQAVSLNARDCQIANGSYPGLDGMKENLVAGSDAAGDVVTVGEKVTKWKVGDRVSPIFSQGVHTGCVSPPVVLQEERVADRGARRDHIDQQPTALGGGVDGVLTEYFKVSEVSRFFLWSVASYTDLGYVQEDVVRIPEHLTYAQACTSTITVRPPPFSSSSFLPHFFPLPFPGSASLG